MICRLLLFVLVFCNLSGESVVAQVGGVSNSKVVVLSAETVPSANFEFEPFFSASFTDDSVDSKNYEAGFRFTKGILDNLEAGFNVIFLTIEDADSESADYNFGDIPLGLKYRFYESDMFQLAYQGGLVIPTSSDDTNWVFQPAGLVFTKNFTDKFSIDLDGLLSFDEDETVFISSNLGAGYFVLDNFQPVLELNYQYENPDNGSSINILSITGGFTALLTDYATLIVGFTKDVVSDNTDDSLSLSAALTLFF